MKHLIILLTSAALVGCASPRADLARTETVLPLQRAWVDGKRVEYITTDVSDAAMARMAGANHVPRLRDALAAPGRKSLVERVYKFAGDEQINIFQSAPLPVGAANQALDYSPLWQLVWVRWLPGAKVRELRSEEELLAAQENKWLALEPTNIVVNCPVTRASDGQHLPGVR